MELARGSSYWESTVISFSLAGPPHSHHPLRSLPSEMTSYQSSHLTRPRPYYNQFTSSLGKLLSLLFLKVKKTFRCSMSLSIVLLFENANVLYYFLDCNSKSCSRLAGRKNSTINYIKRKRDKRHTSYNSSMSFLLVI